MSSLTDESYKNRESEVSRYMAELSGVPMTFEAHLGRFIIHAAVLLKTFGVTDAELANVVRYARKCDLVTQEVPGASGKPN